MRPSLFALLLATALLLPSGVQAQAASAPDFTASAVKVYAHSSEDSLSVWMNTLLDDGAAVPYYFFGASDVPSAAGQTPASDPVAGEDFEARIALTPELTQDLTLKGTVNVQAFIGGGTATTGAASIGTSLVAGGAELGKAAAKNHVMLPKPAQAPQAGTTYDSITWTFDVDATVPKGTKLEWVISGTVYFGNNVFLSTYEARGRSYIELPVTATAGGGTGGPVVQNLTGFPTQANITAPSRTNATHVYDLTVPPGPVRMAVAGGIQAGQAQVLLRDGNATLANLTYKDVNLTKDLTGPGNWTLTVVLQGFQGNFTVSFLAPPKASTTSSTSASTSGSATRNPTTTSTSGTAAGNATGEDDTKDSPGLAAPIVAAGLAALAIVARRRLR